MSKVKRTTWVVTCVFTNIYTWEMWRRDTFLFHYFSSVLFSPLHASIDCCFLEKKKEHSQTCSCFSFISCFTASSWCFSKRIQGSAYGLSGDIKWFDATFNLHVCHSHHIIQSKSDDFKMTVTSRNLCLSKVPQLWLTFDLPVGQQKQGCFYFYCCGWRVPGQSWSQDTSSLTHC